MKASQTATLRTALKLHPETAEGIVEDPPDYHAIKYLSGEYLPSMEWAAVRGLATPPKEETTHTHDTHAPILTHARANAGLWTTIVAGGWIHKPPPHDHTPTLFNVMSPSFS